MPVIRLPDIPGIKTPVGAVTLASTVATAVVATLRSDWPWFAHQPAELYIAVAAILTYVLGYLGGWWKVVSAPGQHLTMELTSSPLPTVQSRPVPPPGT